MQEACRRIEVPRFIVILRVNKMRKQILCFLVIGAIFLLFRCSKKETETTTPECISIVVATDLHYLSPELTDRSEEFLEFLKDGDGKVVHYIEEISNAQSRSGK